MSVNSEEDHDKQMSSNADESRDYESGHIQLQRGFLPSGRTFCFVSAPSSELFTLLRQVQQKRAQKLRQSLIQSATIIQAAWRGYRVRRELDEMNKAAVKIQAAYRGYRTRQELPPGFYDCLRYERLAVTGKKKDEEGIASLPREPGTRECSMQREEGSHVPAATCKAESPAARHRDEHDPSTVVPRAAACKPEVSLTPSKVLMLDDSLLTCDILSGLISGQQVHGAKDGVWDAGRKHQSTEEPANKERPAEKKAEQKQILAYGCQLKPNFCENNQTSDTCCVIKMLKWTAKPKDMVLRPEQYLTVKIGMKKVKKASNAECDAPSIGMIDVHTVVKSLQASQSSPISIRVSSPNGAVEGFQREVGTGQLHGLYTVRRLGGSQPAHVGIYVNVMEARRESGGSSMQQESTQETQH